MAISLKQLIKNRALLVDDNGPQCAVCSILLQETITGKRRTEHGDVCSDCYYEVLGEVIDEHPIVSARVRRG
jgi:hypothetical protein